MTPHHPPIIDAATFDLVQEKVRANRKRTGQLAMATGLLEVNWMTPAKVRELSVQAGRKLP